MKGLQGQGERHSDSRGAHGYNGLNALSSAVLWRVELLRKIDAKL